MALPRSVRLVEVGPRDGLQNERAVLGAEIRVQLVTALLDAGVRDIEVGSFVSASAVPQMAATDSVLAALPAQGRARYSVLVPNVRGYAAASAAGARDIAVFVAASETFSQRNSNCSIATGLERASAIAAAAQADGVRVRGYISCVIDCPFEGAVAPQRVAGLAGRLLQMGCREISLGETIGTATPNRIDEMLAAVTRVVPVNLLAGHFHNSYGQALVNVRAALDRGVAVIDAAVAGLGGCPFAPGAAGNLATEDLLYMLRGMGIETGIDLDKVARAGWWVCDRLGRRPASQVSLTLAAREER